MRGFLSLSQGETAEEMKLGSLETLVEDVVLFVKPKLVLKCVELEIENGLNNISLKFDEKKIYAVLVTLINNSMEAIEDSHEKKWIRIKLFEKEIDNEKYGCLSVVDSGYTPSTEILTQMFEPFFSSKKLGDTLGLSLPIAKSIIHSHDGKIYCKEEEDHTTFEICLPKAA